MAGYVRRWRVEYGTNRNLDPMFLFDFYTHAIGLRCVILVQYNIAVWWLYSTRISSENNKLFQVGILLWCCVDYGMTELLTVAMTPPPDFHRHGPIPMDSCGRLLANISSKVRIHTWHISDNRFGNCWLQIRLCQLHIRWHSVSQCSEISTSLELARTFGGLWFFFQLDRAPCGTSRASGFATLSLSN